MCYYHVSLSLITGKACLGGVWSKNEGDLCDCSSFSFVIVLICSAGLSVCLGRVFHAYVPMEKNLSFSFCGQVRRTNCEFTICPG